MLVPGDDVVVGQDRGAAFRAASVDCRDGAPWRCERCPDAESIVTLSAREGSSPYSTGRDKPKAACMSPLRLPPSRRNCLLRRLTQVSRLDHRQPALPNHALAFIDVRTRQAR